MSEPFWAEEPVTLYLGDCLDVLADMPANSVDAVVCDPPYGLEFMGREWDGADGFRRSLNPADAGRDNVFGRTSRTSPENRTGKPGNSRLRTRVDGRTNPREGKSRVTVPGSYSTGAGQRGKPGIGSRPTDWVSNQGWNGFRCRICGHLAHGGSPCQCENPDFGRADGRWNLYQEWCTAWADECLRVLKPGAFILAFGGTRTWHRLACAIEDAGFEIRDSVAGLTGQDAPGLIWAYSSGFPKNQNAGRAVDMQVCTRPGRHCMRKLPETRKPGDHICPESAEGAPWRGWGTAAKPAWEPVVCARKPLAGTLGVNLLAHSTGALNIDGCRVEASGRPLAAGSTDVGRWPANLVLAHAPSCTPVGVREVPGDGRAGQEPGTRPGGFGDVGATKGDGRPNGPLHGPQIVPVWDCAPGCPVAELDRQSGNRKAGSPLRGTEPSARLGANGIYGAAGSSRPEFAGYADEGGASRFFPVFKYEPKAPASERPRLEDGTSWPTVKPVDLMRWLVRLVTPPGGTVLDLFAGTGTTAEACIVEGFPCVLIDKDPVAAALIRERLRKPIQPDLFGGAA